MDIAQTIYDGKVSTEFLSNICWVKQCGGADSNGSGQPSAVIAGKRSAFPVAI